MFASFRHRDFVLYWTAQLVSLMGTFMQQVALGYLVYNLTGSKWLLGIIGALTLAPSLVFSLPAGVLADRIQRRKLVLSTQSVALLLAFTLATLTATHRLQVWEVLLISTISGIAIAVESPGRQAFVIDLVGKEDLANAIAWNSMIVNGARVVGPAIGGIAIRFVGVAAVFYYNSFSFLAMIVALLIMHLPAVTARQRHPLADLREGLVYIRHTPAVVVLLVLLGTVATFALNFPVVIPIFARDVLKTGAEGLGWMWTAYGLGAVFGSFTVVRWSRLAVAGPLLLLSAFMAGIAELGMAATHALPLTLATLVLVGWGTGTFLASANSAVQARVGDALRGRVLSVYSMIFAGTGPIGGLFTAGLASARGIPLALAAGGGI
ncbi:MAG: MFS transporter, partial [Chloroflexota bacterium]|nr:MFS transporter [Chloroflexota bacterium]